MDDDDFDDLFAECEQLQDSSQESLPTAAARLNVSEDNAWIHNISHAKESTEFHATLAEMRETLSIPQNVRQASIGGSAIIDILVATPRTPVSGDVDMTLEVSEPSTRKRMTGHSSNTSVMGKIEQMFANIAADILDEKKQTSLVIKRRTRSLLSAIATPDHTPSPDYYLRHIRFPAIIVRIMELVYESLRSGTVISKRDIYYRDPALFGNQIHVDRYVDTIAYTLDVPRSMLNVTAVATGIVTGALTIYRRDGSSINAAEDREGTLIPASRDILSVDLKSVKWILVVEKEASFRSIAASSLWTEIASHAVLITGKGYTDIATRAFLRLLSEPSPRNGFASPPVFGLMDFDPDGLAIFEVYKEGSMALAHENHDLRAPRLQWLGLRMEPRFLSDTTLHASQGLLTLTPRDRRKAVTLLERRNCSAMGDNVCEISQALQHMLMLNTKAELQLLDAHPEGMAEFLKSYLRL